MRQKKVTPRHPPNPFGPRRGISVLEVAVSAMLLGVVVTTAAQLVQWSVALHQAALKRRCALEAATRVLDRMTSRDWSAINSQTVKDTPLPPETKEFLGSPQLIAIVTDESTTDKPATTGPSPNQSERFRGKRISVEISWGQRDDNHKVQLTTWVFEPGNVR